MNRYVDGFLLPLRRDRVADYRAIALAASRIWREHGALDYWECVGEDLQADCHRSFLAAAAANDDETVVFAWAVFASREARDAANDRIHRDPRIASLFGAAGGVVDFDRVAHGGFEELVGG